MKKLIITLVCSCLVVMGFSQVMEGEKSMSQGAKNGFTTILQKADSKEAEKAWMKYMKDYKGKSKKGKKSEEIITDNAKIEQMSKNSVDVYASIVQRGDDSELTVWYDLGGAYVNSYDHPDAYSYIQKMMDDFSLIMARMAAEDEVKNQEGVAKDLDKDLSKMVKDKENLEKDIENYMKKIEEAKAKIEENLAEQKLKASEIDAQKKVVEEAKNTLDKLN